MLDAKQILEMAGIAPGMHLAEFGTSRSGHFPLAAARRVGEEGHVYAVDIVPEVLEMLESRCRLEGCQNITPIWGDYERPGGVQIPAASLDAVLLTHGLPSLQEPQHLSSELSRLLKPGGRFIVVDWHPGASHPLAPEAEFCLAPHQAEALLRRHGLVHDTWFEAAPTHWGGVWRLA